MNAITSGISTSMLLVKNSGSPLIAASWMAVKNANPPNTRMMRMTGIA